VNYKNTLRDSDVNGLNTLVKSFSTYFALVNLSEQLQRIWVLAERERQMRRSHHVRSESVTEAIQSVAIQGVPADQVDAWLMQAAIRPVFTAHPTEARRRTTLDKLRRLANLLDPLGHDFSLSDDPQVLAQAREEIVGLWQSDDVRVVRPSVIDEVKNGLYYFEQSIVRLIPTLYRDLEFALQSAYPNHAWRVPALLKFGSWMGGDRDGNPFVRPETTIAAVRLMRSAAIEFYIGEFERISRRISQSDRQITVSPELLTSLNADAQLFPGLTQELMHRYPHEPYRRKCLLIAERLRQTLNDTQTLQPTWPLNLTPVRADIYHDVSSLRQDLQVMYDSLAGAMLGLRLPMARSTI
jgi:phosphoenolpyruvate carboxylase